MSAPCPPVMGLAAWSGTGKTTLLKRMLPLLRGRGLRVGVIKHAHHDFDIDLPGKDSYELRKAGAACVLVGSSRRWALVMEAGLPEGQAVSELLARLAPREVDLVLVEGLKGTPIPKVELHRPSLGKALLCRTDPHVVAVATDAPVSLPRPLPVLDLNRPEQVVEFILGAVRLEGRAVPPSVRA